MLGQSMLPLDIVARYRIALYVYVMQRCAGAMQHTILFVTIYQCVFVVGIGALFSGTRGSFLALSAAGHGVDPPVHHGASFRPGWAP